ncbi:MAG: hypothetical protein K8R44_01255, partial [Sulfurimonas sp.]|nr:hypothetical protein [Sulfurimonas sp.]
MSEVIGKISSLDGKFYVKLSDGSFNEISHGDEIYEGDIVVGDKNNISIDSIRIDLDNGSNVIVYGSETQLFDSSLYSEEFAENETVSDSESIEAMFNSENTEAIVDEDVEDIDEVETEAGEESGSESTEGGEAQFATMSGGIVDINADLREREFDNNIDSKNIEIENVYVDSVLDSLSADIVNLSDSGSSDSDNITNDTTPTITGLTESGSTVIITDASGNEIGRTIADGSGNFTITTTELDDGTQNLNITATDTAGNTKSIIQEITVDTTTTNSVEFTDESGDDVVSASEVLITDISGNIEIGSSINSLTITDGTNSVVIDVNDITLNENGSYNIDNVDLSSLNDGELSVEVISTDIAGNQTSSIDTIQKDTVVDSLSIDNVVSNEAGDEATVTGNTEPHAKVELTLEDANGVKDTVEVTADDKGDYSITFDTSAMKD